MELVHMWTKMGQIIEGFYIYEGSTSNNQFCNKLKDRFIL